MIREAPLRLIARDAAERCYQQQCWDSGCTGQAWSQLHRGVVPQASAARWLDCEFETESACALIAVPIELPCFAGHFPGQPVLPGVLQLVWARQLLQGWQPGLGVSTVKQLKFRQPVLPPAVLRLELHRRGGKIAVRVERPAGIVADWSFVASLPDSAGTV